MSVDHIRYDLLAQEALRGVVRRVLTDVARNGLPGDHHFYVSFDTRAPGVRLSPRMREKYPEEMTIVLQHQFWDLIVTEQGFEVGLSFGGVPERLGVPFTALKGFLDPSVKFGLQFEIAEPQDAEEDAPVDAPEAPTRLPGPAAARPARGAASEPVIASARQERSSDGKAETGTTSAADEKTPGGAEVVRLDVFRKK